MANTLEVRKQLHQAGFRNNYWGWSALRQLPMILNDGEIIERAASGLYDAGHAVILSTNKRILFLDKKVMSFKVEDIHYEMVSEVEHYMGPFAAKLHIYCLGGKAVELSSLRHENVQSFALHVEQKVSQIRLNTTTMPAWAQMLENGQPLDLNHPHGFSKMPEQFVPKQR